MNSAFLAKTLRDNQQEVLRRWFEHLSGNIADDFEQMLATRMGNDVSGKLLSLTIEFLEAEEYLRADILRKARGVARDASFRRVAVGFSLPDIVFTAVALRRAIEATLVNHIAVNGNDEESLLLESILEVSLFTDTVIAGEIAGYFSCRHFQSEQENEEDLEVA